MQYMCLRKEITHHSALRYSFAQLSPARLSEFEAENSLPADAYSKEVFRQEENFPTDNL